MAYSQWNTTEAKFQQKPKTKFDTANLTANLTYGQQANEQRTIFDQLAVNVAELFPKDAKSTPDWKLLRTELMKDTSSAAALSFELWLIKIMLSWYIVMAKMNHVEAAQNLQREYQQILEEFHQVLAGHGLQDFRVHSVEFLHRPSLELSTSGCPPGTVPVTRCVAKPGGGVYCFTVCE